MPDKLGMTIEEVEVVVMVTVHLVVEAAIDLIMVVGAIGGIMVVMVTLVIAAIMVEREIGVDNDVIMVVGLPIIGDKKVGVLETRTVMEVGAPVILSCIK